MVLELCGIRVITDNPADIAKFKAAGYAEVVLPVEKQAENQIEAKEEKPAPQKAGRK
jgi:hypothetical protein